MTYYTYILFSPRINKYYIGSTSDLIEERIRRHNTNHKGFTGKTNDWELRYSERFSTKQEALTREKEIKSKKSRIYIESLIAKLG